MITDAHFHIIDPAFPLERNAGFLPEPFLVPDYTRLAARLGIESGVVVSGSFQAYDQGYLLHALERLGPGFVGVTQLSPDVTDTEIERLAAMGVRGLRFNVRRGPDVSLRAIERLARRVHELAGWHAELYADMAELRDHLSMLMRLPALSIDHLGLSERGLPSLLALVERGAKVKATGFGRVDMDVRRALRTIHQVSPAALMFGTDLPCTRAPRPFRVSDVHLVEEVLGPEGAALALRENARSFYRLEDAARPPGPSLDAGAP